MVETTRGEIIKCMCVFVIYHQTIPPGILMYTTFFNTLTSQIYTFQEMSSVFICGDFNSRTSNLDDYIAGVDSVPVRDVIDY